MRRMAALAERLDRMAARYAGNGQRIVADVLHRKAERVRHDMAVLALRQERRRWAA